MTSSESRRSFHWSAADGRQLELAPGSARITVSEGVSIGVGPGVQDDGRPTVDLDLLTAVVGRDSAGDLSKRFVVIPLDESSLLVAVAEPSEEPANLCPVASTPAWGTPGGGSMTTSEGSLTMLGVNGAQLRMALTPGLMDTGTSASSRSLVRHTAHTDQGSVIHWPYYCATYRLAESGLEWRHQLPSNFGLLRNSLDS